MSKIKKYLIELGGIAPVNVIAKLQELQGGGPPQLQIDSGGAGWSDFGSGVVGGTPFVNVQVRGAEASCRTWSRDAKGHCLTMERFLFCSRFFAAIRS